jgi:hypothetical protein
MSDTLKIDYYELIGLYHTQEGQEYYKKYPLAPFGCLEPDTDEWYKQGVIRLNDDKTVNETLDDLRSIGTFLYTKFYDTAQLGSYNKLYDAKLAIHKINHNLLEGRYRRLILAPRVFGWYGHCCLGKRVYFEYDDEHGFRECDVFKHHENILY